MEARDLFLLRIQRLVLLVLQKFEQLQLVDHGLNLVVHLLIHHRLPVVEHADEHFQVVDVYFHLLR